MQKLLRINLHRHESKILNHCFVAMCFAASMMVLCTLWKSVRVRRNNHKRTDGVAILGQGWRLKNKTSLSHALVISKTQDGGFAARRLRLRASAKSTQSWPGSPRTPSYLLSQCKYRSLAPPPSCLELHSAFSSARLASFRSCASFCPLGCAADITEQPLQASTAQRVPVVYGMSYSAAGLRCLSAYVSVCNGVKRGTVVWSRHSGGADVSVQGQDFWISCMWRIKIRFSAHSLDCLLAVKNMWLLDIIIIIIIITIITCETCITQERTGKRNKPFYASINSNCKECGKITA